MSVDIPLSDECNRILSHAAEEAEMFRRKVIGTEQLLAGILREENCLASAVLHRRGLNLYAVRKALNSVPLPEADTSLREESASSLSFPNDSSLPKSGIVPDAVTAQRIAEAVWQPLYGADKIASQMPLGAELRHNVWIVAGSSPPEGGLFAFIHQTDGRILSMGRGWASAG